MEISGLLGAWDEQHYESNASTNTSTQPSTRTAGVIERGIVLVISLLTLSTVIMAKFTGALHRYGEITVHHLDEV